MLESLGEVFNGSGDFGINRITLPAGGRSMVGFIQNQQRTRTKGAQPISQRRTIVLINQQSMRD